MVSRRNHPLYHFSKTIQFFTSNLASFYAQNTLKKNLPWKMLIEQIIELQLRGPGPPGERVKSSSGLLFTAKM